MTTGYWTEHWTGTQDSIYPLDSSIMQKLHYVCIRFYWSTDRRPTSLQRQRMGSGPLHRDARHGAHKAQRSLKYSAQTDSEKFQRRAEEQQVFSAYLFGS